MLLISFMGFFHGLTNTSGSLISLIFQGLKKKININYKDALHIRIFICNNSILFVKFFFKKNIAGLQ